jgi:DNA-binding Lrp family transcriptional regulator
VIVGYGARLEPRQLRLGLQAFVRVQLEKHDRPPSATSWTACRAGTRWWPATR